jgi:hypothetical protein
VPNKAHDRFERGPFAALLILLGLVFSAGSLAGGASAQHGSTVRQSSVRSSAAVLTARPAERSLFSEEVPDPNPLVPPSPPVVVTTALWARPSAGTPTGAVSAARRSAPLSYRARAPPAL